ncbi:maltose/moltooligosaccharide transporter [Nonlabens dokdonensis]|jgi:maltose/moltooligosaccharide transporter|uniref:Permease n=2 Tax=Nonlabens dokdonensis TaxID=328515 RepID=L7W3I4_NONDD|nr:MFS transporter [Nonlabens dokdonensis]AGC76110.1 permease [Nonlabens dokdonensis DSW-6]PZX43781.1 maltose/moltooligosaccharide transporter [Nonlabens dokdonensis]
MQKPKLGFWNIWNMSFGFLGIQFGFALQGSTMSRIFETLGAAKDDIPLLWIAAPLAGLIVQPIIGYLSDHTWHKTLGRRRPFFLIGAILSSIALLFMPYSSEVWMAAGLLLVLDASINISMEPFRALVADKLPESQRSYGFVVQTLIIGVGTWVASNLPKWVNNTLEISNEAAPGVVPDSVKVAFGVGAFVFITSILVTIFTTKEYSPEEMAAFDDAGEPEEKKGMLETIMGTYALMPTIMKKLGVVQFFSWFAFFAMWTLANPALTTHIYDAPKPDIVEYAQLDDAGEPILDADRVTLFLNDQSAADYKTADKAYNEASDDVGSKMGIYGLTSMLFALLLTFYTSFKAINRKYIHMASLFLGALGFLYMFYSPGEPDNLYISFSLIGIAWGSILSMPYAMLSSSVESSKMGLMMGVFNMFIVIPQIIAAVGGVVLLHNLIGEESIHAMTIAGIFLVIAAFSNLLITNKKAIMYQPVLENE